MKNPYRKSWRGVSEKEFLAVQAHLAKRGVSLDGPDDRSSTLALRNEVRRAINDLKQDLSALLDSHVGDKWTPDCQAKYDAGVSLMEDLGLLNEFIDRQIQGIDFANNVAIAQGKTDGWRNGSGNAVRVLHKGERMSDLGNAPRVDFSFGEFVRGMVGGTSNPDVRAALSEGTDSAGGYTVPRALLNQLIDAMRAKTVCVQAGALTVPLDTAQNTIVRIASDPTAGWRLENASVAESDPTFEGVVLAPKSLAVLVKVSRELIDDSMNLEQALMMAFAGSLAAEVDRVCLVGSGSAPEPRGIFNTAGINVVSMGTNGAAMTDYTNLLDAVYEIELDNGPSPTAMVMHPRTKRVIAGFVDSTGQPLSAPPTLAEVKPHVTTNMPINQTQGTATNASSVIVGDFSQLLLGVRQELRVEVLRESFADKLQYGFLAHLRFDVAVAQPEAFCAVKGIIPAA